LRQAAAAADSSSAATTAHDEPLDGMLPLQWGDNWKFVIDRSDELEPGHQPNPDKPLAIHGRTIVVLTSARSNVEPECSFVKCFAFDRFGSRASG
jgi:hypothetical protein